MCMIVESTGLQGPFLALLHLFQNESLIIFRRHNAKKDKQYLCHCRGMKICQFSKRQSELYLGRGVPKFQSRQRFSESRQRKTLIFVIRYRILHSNDSNSTIISKKQIMQLIRVDSAIAMRYGLRTPLLRYTTTCTCTLTGIARLVHVFDPNLTTKILIFPCQT